MEDLFWYYKLMSFQFQIILYLVVDVFIGLAKSNKSFKFDHLDVIHIKDNLNI
jgi:hypothetical protein